MTKCLCTHLRQADELVGVSRHGDAGAAEGGKDSVSLHESLETLVTHLKENDAQAVQVHLLKVEQAKVLLTLY